MRRFRIFFFLLMLLFSFVPRLTFGQDAAPTTSMLEARSAHTATLLDNGNVLVTGGYSNTAEIYDPVSGTWRYTKNPLSKTRQEATAVKLADGRVLIIGGHPSYTGAPYYDAEVFDPNPANETFTLTGPLNGGHNGARPAFLLRNGKVLIVAGAFCYLACEETVSEIYDPATNTWSVAPTFQVGVGQLAAVKLQDDTVIAFGGYMDYVGTPYSDVVSYNPINSLMSSMDNMLGPRASHTATLLSNNKVLIAGGYDNSYYTTNSTEINDPLAAPNGSSQAGNPMQDGRREFTATLLQNGNVLVVGGNQGPVGGSYSGFPTSLELYDFISGTWSVAGSLTTPRFVHQSTLLPNGQVLVTGGYINGSYTPTATAELWGSPQPTTGMIIVTTNQPAATFIINGPPLYTGGGNSFSQSNVPAGTYTITYGAVPGYVTPRSDTQTLSPGGTVGFSGTYIPATGTINVTSTPSGARFQLNGQGSYSGTTPFTFLGVPVGNYQATFSPISCYLTPPSQTFAVSQGNPVTVNEKYQGAATVSVNVTPAGATSANFSVNPPIPAMQSGSPYPATATGVIPQPYTVTFNAVSGFNPPAPQILSSDNTCHYSFSGTYTPILPIGNATLSVTLSTSRGGFTIAPINNPAVQPIARQGVQSYTTQLPAGKYQIQFSSVPRYYTPATQTVVLNPSDSITVGGLYQRLLVIAFTGFGNAPQAPSYKCLGNHGSGIEYTIPQNEAGMTEILPEIQGIPGVPELKTGITGSAFTFYGKDRNQVQNGDACTPPNGNPDHYDAENWLMSKDPSSLDKIVVLGHSYGANRARLFVEQLKKNQNITADLLVTVDAIEWSACNILNVVTAGDPLNQAAQACNQTTYTSRNIPISSARASFSFYQGIGVFGFPFVEGYAVPNSTSQIVNTDHMAIDDDQGVHHKIQSLILDLVRRPSISSSAGSPVRNGGLITIQITLSATGTNTATSVGITSASLNGVAAQNLSSLISLGDLPAGSSTQISLIFPGTAAQSGKTVLLNLNGQHSSGQSFTVSKRVVVP